MLRYRRNEFAFSFYCKAFLLSQRRIFCPNKQAFWNYPFFYTCQKVIVQKLPLAHYGQISCQVRPPVFFVLGGPGSGKGTQCGMIANTLGLAQICVGDLLRKEALQNTSRGKWIASIIDEGNIVPGFVTLGLLSQAIERERMQGTKAILMDGFPRTLDQAIAFEKEIGRCKGVLYLECSLKVLKQRLLQRGISSGRRDDIERVIEQRLETFEKKTCQVVEYYRKKGILHCFMGEKRAPVEIYKELLEYLQKEIAEKTTTTTIEKSSGVID